MKVIKRIFGDVIGCFELIFVTLFKYNKGLLMFLVSPIYIPIYCIWTIIKIYYHLLKLPTQFDEGKVFMWYGAISGILALLLSSFFPGIYDKLCAFEPISTSGFISCFSNITGSIEGLMMSVTSGHFSIILMLVWLLLMPLALALLVLSFGAVHIPLFAYIWVIMFFVMIVGFIKDTTSLGKQSAVVETFRLIWEYDIRFGLLDTLAGCVEFPINCFLYCTPVLNVIVYRHRLKLDRRERSYPPLDRYGKVDQDKLNRMHNAVYSKFIV